MAIVITGTSITAPDGAIDASDLTGDLDASLLTGTLPAIDGSALTGVEAGMKLISHTEISADVAYFDYTFDTGYSAFLISANNLFRTSGNWAALWARLTDDTDTLITGTGYCFLNGYGTLNPGSQTQINPGTSNISETGHDTSASYFIKVMNPLDPDVCTSFSFFGGGLSKKSGSTYSAGALCSGGMAVSQENKTIRLYPQSGSLSSTSDSVTVWGIK